jgi:hypothetical protein
VKKIITAGLAALLAAVSMASAAAMTWFSPPSPVA